MTGTEVPEELGDFRGESFQKGYAAADADQELAGLVFVLDVQESMPSVARLRDWSLAMVAPQPGETAVDVGCGTGAEVRRLATLVGDSGRAVGIEPHPGLRAVAMQRAADEGSRAEFIDGDAVSLPFEDSSVDVIRCERVFQHLPDPQGAVNEMARILRPGGRVVIIDSDWGTAITRAGDPDVQRRLNEAFIRRLPNPFAGGDLRTQLQRADLEVDPDIGSTAVIFPDFVLEDPKVLRSNATQAVEEGAITAEEADRVVSDVVAAAAVGEALFAVTMFGVVGRQR